MDVDRTGFCNMLGKTSKFTSYRSNRFNCLFQNATALLFHRDDIISLLNEHLSHSNLKLQSILADLADEHIMTNISVFSFCHVFFTEPYWLLMNSQKSYFEFPSYVKKMEQVLGFWSSSDFSPLAGTSVFPDFLCKEKDRDVILSFFESPLFNEGQFLSSLIPVANAFLVALRRQLNDFLDGGIFGGEISDDVKNILDSCPLTNLTGERLFGDLDFDMSKCRNSSLRVRSSKNMWKHNRTAGWLGKQSPCTARKIIEKGIQFGPEYKKRNIEYLKDLKEKIKTNLLENKHKKE